MDSYRRINRAHYDIAQRNIAEGVWVVDAVNGRIWSTFWGKWIGSRRDEKSYAYVSIYRDGRPRQVIAHRVIWESVHGPIPVNMEINHKNGDKADNRIANLELATAAENCRHAMRLGLAVIRRGEQVGRVARLTETDVREIRALLAGGMPQQRVADRFGVTQGSICHINTGATWAHVS